MGKEDLWSFLYIKEKEIFRVVAILTVILRFLYVSSNLATLFLLTNAQKLGIRIP